MKRDHHDILREDYPDIHQLWCDAVNADFESQLLEEQGKRDEAEAMWEYHEEKWAEYCFASKLVLTGHEDLE